MLTDGSAASIKNSDMTSIFMLLSDHYATEGEEAYQDEEILIEDHMPFTVGDLHAIYEHMASHDHFKPDSRAFAYDSDATVGTLEMSDLFDLLAVHYEHSSEAQNG